jgi:hypothetical protein
MKKKLVVSLLSLSMVISLLVGCGSTSSNTSTSESNVDETQINESQETSTLVKEYLNSDDEEANLHGMAKRFYDKYSEIYIISASNDFYYYDIDIDFKCNLK